jgi:hypothetical protein
MPAMLRTATVLICTALLGALAPAASAEAAASWSVSPESYEFAPRPIGTGPSAEAVFTLTNTGTTTLGPPQFTTGRFIDEHEPGDRFQLTSHCESGLAPSESCALEVTFEPTAVGRDTEFLGLSQPEGQISSLSIRLTGSAAVPDLSSGLLFLPSRLLGIELNPPATFTFTNSGAADLHIYGLALTELGTNPVNPDALRIVGGTCGVGVTVAVGGSCTVQMTFTPTVDGQVVAGLEFTDNLPDRNSTLPVGHQIVPVHAIGVGSHEGPIAQDVAVTSGPPAKLRRTWARFRFVVPDARPAFLCRLDAAPYRPCTSPTTYRHLALGRHVFRVRPATTSPTVSGHAAVERFRVLPAIRDRLPGRLSRRH